MLEHSDAMNVFGKVAKGVGGVMFGAGGGGGGQAGAMEERLERER